jgi:hypothetical protein
MTNINPLNQPATKRQSSSGSMGAAAKLRVIKPETQPTETVEIHRPPVAKAKTKAQPKPSGPSRPEKDIQSKPGTPQPPYVLFQEEQDPSSAGQVTIVEGSMLWHAQQAAKAVQSPSVNPIFGGMPAPHKLKLKAGEGTGWGQTRIAKNSEGKSIRVIDAYHAIRLPASVDDQTFWDVFTPHDNAQSEATLDKACWWGGSSLTEVVHPTPDGVWKRVQFIPEQEEHALKFGVQVPLAKLTMDLEKPKTFEVEGHEYTKIEAHFRPPSVGGNDKSGTITRPGDIHNLHDGKHAMEVTRVRHPNGESTVLVAWQSMVVQPRPDIYGLKLDGIGTALGKAIDPSVVHRESGLTGVIGKVQNRVSEGFLDIVLNGHDQALLPDDGDLKKGYPHLMHLLGVGSEYKGRVPFEKAT